jgi:hypothetical protein
MTAICGHCRKDKMRIRYEIRVAGYEVQVLRFWSLDLKKSKVANYLIWGSGCEARVSIYNLNNQTPFQF